MRRLVLIAAALASVATAPLSAQAGAGPPAESQVAPAGTPSAATVDAAAQPSDPLAGLPSRNSPPRTLRAYWHVFIAFAVTWLLLFGYALSVGRRFGKLEDEVHRLRN